MHLSELILATKRFFYFIIIVFKYIKARNKIQIKKKKLRKNN